MRFRLAVFGVHLTGSALALLLVLGALFLGWYRWPGWYLAGALQVVGIVVMVHLVLGPALTLIVASPVKERRVLARDIAVIVTVQVIALGYGAVTLWLGRPLYYTFSVDQLELVQASDLRQADIEVARRENPRLAPYSSSLPRWIWAPLPEDPAVVRAILAGTLAGGPDIVQMPRYFRPWDQGLQQLRAQLKPVDEIRYFSRAEKQRLRGRLGRLGFPATQPALVMRGGGRRVLVLFDPATLRIRAILEPD
jgi:hypothetical protein